MSNAKQELTPEEKLLALIQRDKAQDAAPVVSVAAPVPPPAPPAAPVAAVAVPVPPPAVVVAPPVAPKAEPLPEKKLKLSAQAEKPQVKLPEKGKDPVVEPAPPVKGAESKSMPAAAAKAVAALGATEKPTPVSSPKEATPVVAPPTPSPFMVTGHHGPGGLSLVNRVLALVVLVLLVFVVYSVASIRADVAMDVRAQVASAGSLTLAPVAMVSESVPDLDFFLGKVSRNIFLPIGSPVSTNSVGPVVVMEKAGDLKLVGISMDAAVPEESLAIIKNKADSKTYFVKAGESIGDTGLILARVLADRVVLKSQKQEFELK